MTKQATVQATVAAPKAIESVDLSKCPTTSAKIRLLNAEGFSTGAIAKVLGKRYQHVRNVLVTPVAKPVTTAEAAA